MMKYLHNNRTYKTFIFVIQLLLFVFVIKHRKVGLKGGKFTDIYTF